MKERLIVARRTSPITRAAALCVVALVALSAPALAAFPGKNGRIAFSGFIDGKAGIWTINPDGSDRTLLIDEWWATGPSWSPDGQRVAFARNGQIAILGADKVTITHVTSPAQVSAPMQPSWSPDGTQVVFEAEPPHPPGYYIFGPRNLWIANADGTGLRQLTQEPYASSPAWSPDGSRIAFVTYVDGLAPVVGVHTIDPAGATAPQLVSGTTGPQTAAIQPDWSPDGTKLAFVRTSGQGSIWTVNADGSSAQQLFGPANSPAWSPDGAALVLEVAAPVFSLATIPASGGAFTVITESGAYGASPDWQPIGPVLPTPDPAPTATATAAPTAAPSWAPSPSATPAARPVVGARFVATVLTAARRQLTRLGLRGLGKPWTFRQVVPLPGTVEVTVLAAAKRKASAAAATRVVVANGRGKAAAPGAVKVTVKPTKAGRKLLRGARKLKLTVRVRYTPDGLAAISAEKTLTVKRR